MKIIIPDTAKEKPIEGKVIAAGNGKLNEEGKRMVLEVKKGDRILFGKYSGDEVKIIEETTSDYGREKLQERMRMKI
jgi:co-chaperonin GroES (HSP10)